MDKTDFERALGKLRKEEKRNFKQSVDLIVNLKGIDLKKPEEQVDIWIQLPHKKPKKVRIGALVGAELIEQAKTVCDGAVLHDDFKKFKDKKALKKLANDFDFFIAQANIMPDVAKIFGRVFGPRGKMPNPKAGCVVPPNANLKTLVEKLQKTLHLTAKIDLAVKCPVGSEEMTDEQVVANSLTVYNAVVNTLPQEEQNIKNVMLKFTMSKPVLVQKEAKEKAGKKKAEPKPAEKPKEEKKEPEKKQESEKKEPKKPVNEKTSKPEMPVEVKK